MQMQQRHMVPCQQKEAPQTQSQTQPSQNYEKNSKFLSVMCCYSCYLFFLSPIYIGLRRRMMLQKHLWCKPPTHMTSEFIISRKAPRYRSAPTPAASSSFTAAASAFHRDCQRREKRIERHRYIPTTEHERPKSAIFGSIVSSKSTFADLRSRCQISQLCTCAIADAIP